MGYVNFHYADGGLGGVSSQQKMQISQWDPNRENTWSLASGGPWSFLLPLEIISEDLRIVC